MKCPPKWWQLISEYLPWLSQSISPREMVSLLVVLTKAPPWSFHHVFKAVLADKPAEWNTGNWQVLDNLDSSVPTRSNLWWASSTLSWCHLTYTMLQFWRMFTSCILKLVQTRLYPLATGWHSRVFSTHKTQLAELLGWFACSCSIQ